MDPLGFLISVTFLAGVFGLMILGLLPVRRKFQEPPSVRTLLDTLRASNLEFKEERVRWGSDVPSVRLTNNRLIVYYRSHVYGESLYEFVELIGRFGRDLDSEMSFRDGEITEWKHFHSRTDVAIMDVSDRFNSHQILLEVRQSVRRGTAVELRGVP